MRLLRYRLGMGPYTLAGSPLMVAATRSFAATPTYRNVSNTIYDEFLVTERDHKKSILEEAHRKHPLNPIDVPPQAPGDDKAPIPVPSGNIVSAEAAKRHVERLKAQGLSNNFGSAGRRYR